MNRTFLFHAGLLLWLNLLVKPFYLFFIDRNVQNLVGAESYGTFYLVFNFAYLFSLSIDLGTHHYALTQVSENKARFAALIPSILVLRLVGAALYVLLLLGFGYLLGYLQYESIFGLVAVTTLLVSTSLFLRAQLQALGFFTLESFLSILDKCLLTLILGYIILLHPALLTVQIFVQVQLAVWMLVCLVIGIVLLRHAPTIRWKVEKSILSLLAETLPFALVLVLMLFYNRVDVVMLKMLHAQPGQEAGIYAAGYRILDFLNMAGFMLGSLSIPMFARLKGSALRDLLRTCFDLMWLISCVASIGIWFYKVEITRLLYWEATTYWSDIVGTLCLNFVFIGTGYILSSFLTAKKQLTICTKLFVLAIGINVFLNVILIPSYGALGAAWTTLATQCLVVLGFYYYTRSYFKPTFDVLGWRHIFFASLCLVSFGIVQHFFPNPIYFVLLSALLAAIGLPLGLLNVTDMKHLFQSKR